MDETGVAETVNADHFFRLDIRVGRVVECSPLPRARVPAYHMVIDFGRLGTRASSARLTEMYTADDLIGTMIAAVLNLPPRQIGPVLSEVLVLGAYVEGTSRVALLRPDEGCVPGDRVG